MGERRDRVGSRREPLRVVEVRQRWHEALTRLDLVQLPVTAEHAAGVDVLPWHHRDPFDRILVAQAVAEEATVLTSDRQLETYNVDILWT